MQIKVGSRESKLAVIQSKIVMDYIEKYHSGIETKLVTMKTTGDIILNKPLDKIGGKGLFVKELDKALLDGQVDFTVHSFKDMPMETDENLPIVAVSKREDPRDVLILPDGIKEIDFTKPIGCSSQRRKIQLEKIYPQAEIKSIRGNVLTRLEKLNSGEFSAIILAYAGIKRLGLEEKVSKIFTIEEILPAACQGVLAVQARKGFDISCLSSFHDETAYDISTAERSFTKTLDGGCSSPVAAYGIIEDGTLILTGFYVDKNNNSYKNKLTGNPKNGEQIGRELAILMKKESETYE